MENARSAVCSSAPPPTRNRELLDEAAGYRRYQMGISQVAPILNFAVAFSNLNAARPSPSPWTPSKTAMALCADATSVALGADVSTAFI